LAFHANNQIEFQARKFSDEPACQALSKKLNNLSPQETMRLNTLLWSVIFFGKPTQGNILKVEWPLGVVGSSFSPASAIVLGLAYYYGSPFVEEVAAKIGAGNATDAKNPFVKSEKLYSVILDTAIKYAKNEEYHRQFLDHYVLSMVDSVMLSSGIGKHNMGVQYKTSKAGEIAIGCDEIGCITYVSGGPWYGQGYVAGRKVDIASDVSIGNSIQISQNLSRSLGVRESADARQGISPAR
jgi:hypothetical protein